ncbi:MAG: DUF559 domain-containing protein [Acidimicrobiaceae bacterium]|nr:DUF559 domain-containing protein [Acidimicrobiaceae bacterium]
MDETISGERREAADQTARERAFRVIDYLGDLYTVKFPSVHAVKDYKDVRLPRARFDAAPDASVGETETAWLRLPRPEFPPAPLPPRGLKEWIAGEITPKWTPAVIHPDATSQRLLSLVDTPYRRDGQAIEIADLRATELRELGFDNEDATELGLRALDDRQEIEEMLEQTRRWYAATVEPWQRRCSEIAQVRALFDDFFELRGRLDREGDLVELVFGFGWLRWTVETKSGPTLVDYPLLTAELSITWDKEVNALLVAPNGPLELDLHWISGIEVADRESLRQEASLIATNGLDPWKDDCTAVLERVLRAINYDGVLSSDELPTSRENTAVVDASEWMIFVRRRQPNYQQYLDDLRELFDDPSVRVPPAFAAVVTDEPSLFDQVDPYAYHRTNEDPASSATPPISEMLLPLPSNEEQERILQLAISKAGVTAQGPPGTGKSHTIANLISHFLAQGKRILVTAEKEQALKVLLDKVPPDIRDLCVAILGNDLRARQHLRASVTKIASVATETADVAEIKRLKRELESLSEGIAQLINRQKRAREAEVLDPPLPPPPGFSGVWSPSTAAVWLVDNEEGLGGIQDQIEVDHSLPLADAEFKELCELLGSIVPEDRRDALQLLPDIDVLPIQSTLRQLWGDRSEIRNALDSLKSERREGYEEIELSAEILEELARDLDRWATWLTTISGSWLEDVMVDARDERRSQPWRDFCDNFDSESEEIVAELRLLSAYEIRLPDSLSGLRDEFEEALGRLRDGKRAVKRFDRQQRETLDACRIDKRSPESIEDFELLLKKLRVLEARRRLRTRWTNLPLSKGAPELEESVAVERTLDRQRRQIGEALEWERSISSQLTKRLVAIGFAPEGSWNPAALSQAAHDVRVVKGQLRLKEIDRTLAGLRETLTTGAPDHDSSYLWRELLEALDLEDGDAWSRCLQESERLGGLATTAARLRDLHDRLRTSLPRFAAVLDESGGELLTVAFSEAWGWRQVESWLDDLLASEDAGDLQRRIEDLTARRRRVISDLVAAMAWVSVIESIDDRRRRALNEFVTANAKLGKGTGRYAARWEQQIRAALDRAKDAVPVWIMPIHKVIASFRPTSVPPFDVIIIDEASQVSLLNLPILVLARQAIVVGDEKQTSPENVGLDQSVTHELMDQHLLPIVDRATRFDVNNSLYDLARQQFPQVVRLREHFRCLPRIIEFSSNQWYDGEIVPLRDRPPKQGWKPLASVFVENGARRPNDDVNEQEAEAVCALIETMIDDEDYAEMDFGVVTLQGKGQARHLQDLLLDRLGPTIMEERKLRVGEPAGFQGDERDVIILSMVVANDSERRIGAMTKETDERRINVAASRARNQMWIVHSVMPNDLNAQDPRRKLLEHCLSEADEERRARQEEKTDSQFERDVLRMIQGAGYTEVTTQYEVGRYRIDIVIEGPEQRVAVECDGDTWHGPDRWDHDRYRQSVLERAGWTFVRVRGSAFYHDRQRALQPLWERLDELDIPRGDWTGSATEHKIRRVWPHDFADQSDRKSALSSGLTDYPIDDRSDDVIEIEPRHDGGVPPPCDTSFESAPPLRLSDKASANDQIEPVVAVEDAPRPLEATGLPSAHHDDNSRYERRFTSNTTAGVGSNSVAPKTEQTTTTPEEELIQWVIDLGSDFWFQLSHWAKQTDNLRGWQRAIAYTVGRYLANGKTPSQKQASQCQIMHSQAIGLGFDPAG